MNNLTWLMLCWFALCAQTQSQPPVPAPLKAGHENEKDAGHADKPRPDKKSDTQEPPITLDHSAAQEDERPHENPAANGQDETPAEWWTRVSAIVNLLFTFFLVLTAIIQCAMMYFHWSVMSKEMKATQDAAKATSETVEQMRLEQRAWLCCGKPTVDELKADSKVKMSASIQNAGRTPATMTRELVWCYISTDLAAFTEFAATMPKTIELECAKRQITVSPEYTTTLVGYIFDKPMGQEVIDGIKSGRIFVWTIVRVVYLDVFNAEHVTQACYIYEHAHGEWQAYHSHNLMT